MKHSDHLVLVLDDNLAILTGLERLLTANGYSVRLHQDPDQFLAAGPPDVPACLLLDNQLEARLTGIEVHAELIRRDWSLPTIFLTAHWNVQSVVAAIQSGADGFLTKPYDPNELLLAVAAALERAQAAHCLKREIRNAQARAASLTKREREIVRLVLAGKLNKDIADELGLALVTVKVHRGRAMAKLGAGNPAELARIADQAASILKSKRRT